MNQVYGEQAVAVLRPAEHNLRGNTGRGERNSGQMGGQAAAVALKPIENSLYGSAGNKEQAGGRTGERMEQGISEHQLYRVKNGKIRIGCVDRNSLTARFLAGIACLSVLSLAYLQIDWLKLVSRIPAAGLVFWELGHLSLKNADLIASAMTETISIAVLSLLYSLVLGLLFGMLAARNVFRLPWLSVGLKAFFTFLRAVPTPVWVLLMLVCLGMGPEAGVAGLCVHTTAFFTKSFAQSFESISDDILEALEATGAGRLAVFTHAVLPSALSQLTAWVGMRLEVNFSECAILGMVGAGGIGYVISNRLQSYDYGTAGTAIILVFLIAYAIERVFVVIKKRVK